MKRFLTRLAHFFWSWRFLKAILWGITLIIFLYAEENWRGARAWTATKTAWEAKGISFDPRSYIPAPIPPSQNLAAIPLFKQEPTPENPSRLYPARLWQAIRRDLPGNELPPAGHVAGDMPDMAKIRATIATNYQIAFKDTVRPQDSLAQFEALYPFVAELRSANAIYPKCRLELDYTQEFPATRSFELLTSQVKVSQILTLDALLALDDHKPDVALQDIETILKLISGVQKDPSILGGLVGIAMMTISENAIYSGLALHSWNDAQLAELENELRRIDLLANYQFCMRSEAIVETIPNFDWLKKRRPDISMDLLQAEYDPLPAWIFIIWPSGWMDHNKSRLVSSLLSSAELIDPMPHRVFSGKADETEVWIEQLKVTWSGIAPWNIFFTMTFPAISAATSKFAQEQAGLDEVRIACALERYRLAHGSYPDALSALAPTFTPDIPLDVITGQPYHYQLWPDGTFLLYSVGWNQKDDGGKIVYEKETPARINHREGDWVCPIPKIPATK